jgi:catechol 2,3-dioxygenase-like lactoylglutathione lyase family enzyme
MVRMHIVSIAGFATITRDASASRALYSDALGLPLNGKDDYLSMDGFPGAHHFGTWPLQMAAQCCFGRDAWPTEIAEPTSTLEFEMADVAAVQAAVEELKGRGYVFIHEARLEPWGQTVARFMSPEGVLLGLSYAPWLHKDSDKDKAAQ